MPKVLCTLPNASEEISGVKFVTHANGMLSEHVSEDVAEAFSAIPGYEIISVASDPVTTTASTAQAAAEAAERAQAEAEAAAAAEAAAKSDRDALLTRAEAAGLKVKGSWGNERLKAEVEAAEKLKAEAGAQGAGDAGKSEGDAQ